MTSIGYVFEVPDEGWGKKVEKKIVILVDQENFCNSKEGIVGGSIVHKGLGELYMRGR